MSDDQDPTPVLEPVRSVPIDPMLLADPDELDTYGRPSVAQKAASDAESKKLAEAVQSLTSKAVPEPTLTRPDWALIPSAGVDGQPFRFPKGRSILFMRFLKEWTDTPLLGDRQIICWSLSPGDYRFALDRAQGDGNRINDELTKQMFRAIDGHPVDWASGGAYSPDTLWGQMGQRCRHLATRIYLQLNTLSAKETRAFFETCIAVVNPG